MVPRGMALYLLGRKAARSESLGLGEKHRETQAVSMAVRES